MPTDALFKPLPGAAPATMVTLFVDGQPLQAAAGSSLAAALLAARAQPFRQAPVSGAPRAPFCMMGVCFDCLVEVDGQPSRQACLLQVQPGMQVRTRQGLPSLEAVAAAGAGHDR